MTKQKTISLNPSEGFDREIKFNLPLLLVPFIDELGRSIEMPSKLTTMRRMLMMVDDPYEGLDLIISRERRSLIRPLPLTKLMGSYGKKGATPVRFEVGFAPDYGGLSFEDSRAGLMLSCFRSIHVSNEKVISQVDDMVRSLIAGRDEDGVAKLVDEEETREHNLFDGMYDYILELEAESSSW